MKDGDYSEAMQGLSVTEAAISRMWSDADGPTRVSLLEAQNLIQRARAKLRRAREKAAKAEPPMQE